MITSQSLDREADIISRYLIGKSASPSARQLYAEAVSSWNTDAKTESRLLKLAFGYPFLIGALDAGLVFCAPQSVLRRRIFVMFAVLEASPDYWDFFLPKKRSLGYLFVIGLSGLRAIYRAIFGVLLIKSLRLAK